MDWGYTVVAMRPDNTRIAGKHGQHTHEHTWTGWTFMHTNTCSFIATMQTSVTQCCIRPHGMRLCDTRNHCALRGDPSRCLPIRLGRSCPTVIQDTEGTRHFRRRGRVVTVEAPAAIAATTIAAGRRRLLHGGGGSPSLVQHLPARQIFDLLTRKRSHVSLSRTCALPSAR